MNANRAFAIASLAAAVALASTAALAAPSLLSTDYRYAAQADRTFARGGGTVSASKLLTRGLRLAAPAAKGDDKAKTVATAVYRFKVPLAATLLTIQVGYRPDAAAKDTDVAGFLFVRNAAMEKAAAEAEGQPKSLDADPAFFGNLYFLKGGDTTTSITLPAENHVVDGVLEVHLSAGAGQAFDAQYVQVVAYRSAAGYAAAPRAQAQSGRANDPLNLVQQRRQVFYGAPFGVPNLYPNLYGAGHATSQDPIFWHQLWLQQYPNGAYQYPYLYYPVYRHHSHKKKK